MKAVIYARYSSDSQREESIEGQLRECTAFAEKNGITVSKNTEKCGVSAISDSFRRSQHKKYGLGRYEIQFWRDRAFQPSPHLTKAHKIKRPVDFTIPGGNRRLFHSL